jgi:hypothetical protein
MPLSGAFAARVVQVLDSGCVFAPRSAACLTTRARKLLALEKSQQMWSQHAVDEIGRRHASIE